MISYENMGRSVFFKWDALDKLINKWASDHFMYSKTTCEPIKHGLGFTIAISNLDNDDLDVLGTMVRDMHIAFNYDTVTVFGTGKQILRFSNEVSRFIVSRAMKQQLKSNEAIVAGTSIATATGVYFMEYRNNSTEVPCYG